MKLYILFLTACIILAGCCKDDTINPEPDNSRVFVAGVDYENQQIAYWKDGEKVVLKSDVATGNGDALGIALSGDDVYVAGFILNDQGKTMAVYWKNGELHPLSTESENARAYGIVVSGDDVYVVGHEYNAFAQQAVCWKNGEPQVLSNSVLGSDAMAVFVNGSDVYVAGLLRETNSEETQIEVKAVYWKNGVVTRLSDGSVTSIATGITVSGDNVYVAAVENHLTPQNDSFTAGVYWRNGIRTALTPTVSTVYREGFASGIAFHNGDVYVSGCESDQANAGKVTGKYWEDGDPIEIGEESFESRLYAIAVLNGDVYTTGTKAGAGRYWRNNNEFILEGGMVIGKAIAVRDVPLNEE